MPKISLEVALNATAMLTPLTGIGRYVKELSLALNQLGVHVRYFDVLNGWRNQPPEPMKQSKAGKLRFLNNLPGFRRLAQHIQQSRFAHGVLSPKVCLYHEPNYLAFRFPGPTVVSAHDASWVRYPETHPIERVRIMNRLFPKSLEQANLIIVDSDFVAHEMNALFGVPFRRIRRVHLGVTSNFRPMSESETQSVCKNFGLEYGGFVLAVGTLEPRKNLASLIRAYRKLPSALSRHYPLVIAGMSGWQHELIDHEMALLERQGALRILGHVDDLALPAIYASARLFVYPSIYEGFGLPPLEAMASGIPVIVSDRASMPEVVEKAGICIDPYNVDALTESMRNVLEDRSCQENMRSNGLKRAQLFAWSDCARQTLDVYQEAIAQQD